MSDPGVASSGTFGPGVADEDGLRRERDRFLAFAYCWSDMVIELDSDHRVVFADGATRSLLGYAPQVLRGRHIVDLVIDKDRSRARGILADMAAGERPQPTAIGVQGASKRVAPVWLTGYRVAELQNHYYLSFKLVSPRSDADATHAASRSDEPELHDAESFAKAAADLIQVTSGSENARQLTLMELENFPQLVGRLDADAYEQMVAGISAQLRTSSVSQSSAAQLAEGRYGVIHDPDLDVAGLGRNLAETTRKADPEGLGVIVHDASIALSAVGLEQEDAANALIFAIRRWGQQGPGREFSLGDLSKGLPSLVQDVQTDVVRIKSTIRAKAFTMAFQPIVELSTRQTHHYEILARIDGEFGSPFEFICKAEDLGLIKDFDMAMCRMAIDYLRSRNEEDRTFSLAVNLSAQSISDERFVAALIDRLREHEDIGSKLLFEITESQRIDDLGTTNKAIQTMRSAGHQICLDDFGVGETSLQHLRQLQIDVVKIDGSYVREAFTNPASQHILKAIVNLCQDLEVKTVAEMIEDEKTVDFLLDCGVDYGQGYLFGKPNSDIAVFQTQPAVERVLRGGGIVEVASR